MTLNLTFDLEVLGVVQTVPDRSGTEITRDKQSDCNSHLGDRLQDGHISRINLHSLSLR